MRKVRIAVCFLFVVSCILFGVYIVKVRMVEDHTPPVLTCTEDTISVSVEAENEELLKGITATDDRDGDLTKSVRVSSMSHFIEKGKRTVTYVVFDKVNQAATVERTLVYTDYVSPRIHLMKPLRYTVNDLRSLNFNENMTAEDCLDGDLTTQIHTVWGESLYMLQPGSYPLKIQVNNSAGDVCLIPVDVEIVDSSDRNENSKWYPMLSEYIAYTKVGKKINPDSYLEGVVHGNAEYSFEKDAEFLDVTKKAVSVKSNVDYKKPGVYTVDYTYKNKEGVPATTKLYVVVEE